MTDPEVELLLSCARTRLLPEDVDRIGDRIRRGIDWKLLYERAIEHRIVPLVYTNLKTLGWEGVPAAARDSIEEGFYENAARQALVTTGLVSLMHQMAANGVSAVPFKGPVLAATAYGDVLLRKAGDVDLLVRPRDVVNASGVLHSAGYLPRSEFPTGATEDEIRKSHQYSFVREDGMVVDLQWAITRRFLSSPLDMPGVWERLRSVSLGGATIPTLAPADHLLLLCLHGAKHCWSRLMWICDIAELNEKHPPDWNRLLEEASLRGGRRMLLLGLHLSHELLGAPLPTHVSELARRDTGVRALAREVSNQLLYAPTGSRNSNAQELLFNLRARDRLRDKMRFALLLAPSRTSKTMPGTTTRVSLLRHLRRPIRLLRKYGPMLVKGQPRG